MENGPGLTRRAHLTEHLTERLGGERLRSKLTVAVTGDTMTG
jgi:hypothetical protein